MTRTGEAARPVTVEERTESYMDWLRTRSRELMLGGMVVAALAIGAWLYARSADIKAANADRDLRQAEMQLAVGNREGAQRELEAVVQRYGGTNSGTMAAIRLAQLLYEGDEFEAGIQRLEEADGQTRRSHLRPAVLRLIGAGHEELGNHADAARFYRQAAAESDHGLDRALSLAAAARALAAAGDRAAAVEIWGDLSSDEGSLVAPEARLRLGELTATPASGG